MESEDTGKHFYVSDRFLFNTGYCTCVFTIKTSYSFAHNTVNLFFAFHNNLKHSSFNQPSFLIKSFFRCSSLIFKQQRDSSYYDNPTLQSNDSSHYKPNTNKAFTVTITSQTTKKQQQSLLHTKQQ